MDRPSLHPSVHIEVAAEPRRHRRSPLRRFGAATLSVAWAGCRLLFKPLGPAAPDLDEHSRAMRLLRGVLFRLAAVPVVLGAMVAALVWTATHPVPVSSRLDPSSLGLYFETVPLTDAAGGRSTAWYVPTLDAREVLEARESALTQRRPAVVLVHDAHAPVQSMLPYLKALHAADTVTLTVLLRGAGTNAPRGATFGLREAGEVAAAVRHLRSLNAVDPDRIAVVGVGTGATAALIAARADTRLRAVVAVRPPQSPLDVLDTLTPRHNALDLLRPLARWGFEVAYDVDPGDGDLTRLTLALRERNALYLGDDAISPARQLKTVTHFLASHFAPPAASPAVAGSRE